MWWRRSTRKNKNLTSLPTSYVIIHVTQTKGKWACSLSFSFLLPQQFIPLVVFKFCFFVKTWLRFRFWPVAHISQLLLSCSHSSEMFSWGQDSHRGFRVKDNDDDTVAGGVHISFHPGYVVRELAASRGARAFVSGDMEAFMVSGHGSEDGRTRKVKPSWVFCSLFPLSWILTARIVTEHNETLLPFFCRACEKFWEDSGSEL